MTAYVNSAVTSLRSANDGLIPETLSGQVVIPNSGDGRSTRAMDAAQSSAGGPQQAVSYWSTSLTPPMQETSSAQEPLSLLVSDQPAALLEALDGAEGRDEAAVWGYTATTAAVSLVGDLVGTDDVRVVMIPRVQWVGASIGIISRDVARDNGFALSEGGVVYSGLSEQQVSDVGSAVYAAGLDPSLIRGIDSQTIAQTLPEVVFVVVCTLCVLALLLLAAAIRPGRGRAAASASAPVVLVAGLGISLGYAISTLFLARLLEGDLRTPWQYLLMLLLGLVAIVMLMSNVAARVQRSAAPSSSS